MKYTQYLVVVIVVLLVGSCNKDESKPSGTLDPDSVINAWLTAEGLTATRDGSGVYYYPITQNASGAPVGSSGQVLSFFYRLLDLDGNVIASFQPANGDSLLYKYASNAVFPLGLDQGIGAMRTGETYGLLLPPSQGYADVPSLTTADGTGVTLLEVSLVGVQSEADINQEELNQLDNYIAQNNLDDDGEVEYFNSGIRYLELTAGSGNNPINGDTLIFDYQISYLDGTTVASGSGLEYIFGSGVPNFLVPALDFGLSLMAPSEEGLIMVPSGQAYRESARVVPDFIIGELIDADIIPDYVASVEPYKPLLFRVTRVR